MNLDTQSIPAQQVHVAPDSDSDGMRGEQDLEDALNRLAASISDIHEFIRLQCRTGTYDNAVHLPAASVLSRDVQKKLLWRVCELESMLTLVRKEDGFSPNCSTCKRNRIALNRQKLPVR